MLPLTRVVPKEFVPLAGKPVIQHLIEECCRAGIREVIFIVNKNNRPLLEKYFDPQHARYMRSIKSQPAQRNAADLETLMRTMRFRFVLQQKPLGDGNALLEAKRFIGRGEWFFVSLGDLLVQPSGSYIKEMYQIARKHNGYVLATDKVPPHQVNRYGIVEPAKRLGARLLRVRDIIEKPEPHQAPSNIALIGKYIFDAGIFEELERTAPDKKGEVKLAYAIAAILQKRKKTILAYQIRGRHFDCGDWGGLEIAARKFQPATKPL